MKLVDFTNYEDLIDLKKKVGAKDRDWSPENHWKILDVFDLRSKLEKFGEADITLDKIDIGKSGQLTVAGRTIAAYIRDQYADRGEYKYHVADCRTLKEARNHNRYERYVAYTKNDGIFTVNKVYDSGYQKKGVLLKLKVCKNCLSSLNYKNYNYLDSTNRNIIYEKFELQDFFDQFKSTNVILPKYTDLTAPINDYPKDFRKVADQVKSMYEYRCVDCKRDLSNPKHRKFLHMHHKNSRKDDNSFENLEPVCIECHDKKPGHSLSSHPDYWEFKSIFMPDLFGK